MKIGFGFEKKLWRKGYYYVGGADEVGRGCFAGPVVAACVVFSRKTKIPQGVVINDSKKVSARQREKSYYWIRKYALRYGIGLVSVSFINRLGIKKATETAFRKAAKRTGRLEFLLVDAFYVPYIRGLRRKNQKAIIKGDSKSLSIAASSILAKVFRDRYMVKLSEERKFKKYQWDKNKGYGTKEHREAIIEYGISKHHRSAFVASFLRNFFSSQA